MAAEHHVPKQLSCILSTHSQIITLILKEIRGRDLRSAALVCQAWHNAATALRRARTELRCISRLGSSDERIFAIQEDDLPSFCLAIIKYKLYNECATKLIQGPTFHRSVVHGELQKSLPSTCESVLLTCIKFPIEDKISDVMLITFPDIPGVKINQFYIDEDESENLILPNYSDLKCVIIFVYSCKAKSVAENLLQKIRVKNDDDDFILAVFMLSDFVLHDKRHEYDFIKVITFSGHMRVTSVLLNQEVTTEDAVTSEMTRHIGNHETPIKLALMFAERQRKSASIDVHVLTQLCPNTLLAGLEVEDVLTVNEDRLVSTLPSWQTVPLRLREFYTRSTGPSQILLFSW